MLSRIVSRSFSTVRPFKILGLQQIAIGGLDKQIMSNFWVDTLGLKKLHDFKSEKENVDEDILSLGKGPFSVEVDIMQPLNINNKPRVDMPPLNHIGLWVDNLQVCVDDLTSKGVRFAPGGIRKGAGGHDVCFIHPKSNDAFPLSGCGVLVELVQAPEDVIEAYNKQ